MEYKYKDLVDSFKNGDTTAGEELIRRLKPLMYSLIVRYGNGLEYEELYQEACVALLEGTMEYDPDKGLPYLAYIKTKLRFSIYNAAQKLRRFDYYNMPCVDGEGEDLIGSIPDPGEEIDNGLLLAEELDNLVHAFNYLDDNQKRVISLHYFGGFKLKDIAVSMGLSYKTVLRIKERALKKMRNYFD